MEMRPYPWTVVETVFSMMRGGTCVVGHTLILGGARSGKSRFAEETALQLSRETSQPVVYIATATVTDSEMKNRIEAHQTRRPVEWTTVEESMDVVQELEQRREPAIVVLDCLSLLLNNWMFAGLEDSVLAARIEALGRTFESFRHPLLVVSNEVGQGIVPENSLARRYRDQLGTMNQRVARTAEHVVWMVAGIPVELQKRAPNKW